MLSPRKWSEPQKNTPTLHEIVVAQKRDPFFMASRHTSWVYPIYPINTSNLSTSRFTHFKIGESFSKTTVGGSEIPNNHLLDVFETRRK